jgi:hypothetical protein
LTRGAAWLRLGQCLQYRFAGPGRAPVADAGLWREISCPSAITADVRADIDRLLKQACSGDDGENISDNEFAARANIAKPARGGPTIAPDSPRAAEIAPVS